MQSDVRTHCAHLYMLRNVLFEFTDEEQIDQVRRCRPGFRHNPVFFLLFLHPFRHPFGAANQAEILGTAERAEMADVEQMKKSVPFVTCEVSFCQHVCHLVFGVNVTDLDFVVMRIVFYAIRLGPKTSVYEMNVNVVSTVTGL